MSLILRSLLVALVLLCGAQLARADNASPFGIGAPGAESAPSDAPPQGEPSLFRRAGAQDQPGEGIGLANVRALAYRLGGTVSLRSVLGEGDRAGGRSRA